MKDAVRQIYEQVALQKISPAQAKQMLLKLRGEEGGKTPEFELLPVQRCFFSKNFTDMKHWNESIKIHSRDRLDTDVMTTVIKKLMNHHGALRLVFRSDGGKYVQRFKNVEEFSEVLSVFEIGEDWDIKEYVLKEAQRIHRTMELEEGPLIRFAIFRAKDGDYFFMAVHHLITDGLSLEIIMEDIGTGYLQAQTGAEIDFGSKTTDFMQWAEFINRYALGGDIINEMEYWDAVESTSIQRLPRDFETSDVKLENNAELYFDVMGEEETKKLIRDCCNTYKANVESILLCALGTALERWGGMENTCVRLCGNGRDLPFSSYNIFRTIGWLSISYPFVIQMEKGTDHRHRIENLKSSFSQIPNKGAGYDILRFITLPQKYPEKSYVLEPEIFFNYMGFIGGTGIGALSLADIDTGSAKSLNSQREYVFVIEVMVVSGKLRLRLIYNRKEYKESTINALAKQYALALEEFLD
ncbi:non-ribosomal peptide synthase protein (TIGR01720 family) [Anaerobacterium chartisolvens]|uniref:Non-ribosomal peptide synthase protein (TIGR01720 family) n=1 Tax=Anaerobacterium chartisolvens TaxID=1297424 RepID=A0A369BAJ5_9FIRM|nr:condensation domain-containing protein [Anaerobacterium chartisolvens]RCX17586.1 non-ribosomal peptide synthase protein (TIGR01720 family) [Anaerobacterium chartisolvens]